MTGQPPNEAAWRVDRLIDRLRRCGDGADVSVLHEIAAEFDLRQVSYLGLRIPKRTQREPYLFSTFPVDWIARYRGMSYMEIDPVITQAESFLLPTDWDTLEANGSQAVKALFGEAREFGIGAHGMSLPLRGPRGEYALFSLTSDLSAADWRDWQRVHAASLQLLGYHVHQKVVGPSESAPPLAPREVEVLRWAARGRTVQDTADILALSERTVRFYLELARSKLNALNTTHAVAIALNARLIDLID